MSGTLNLLVLEYFFIIIPALFRAVKMFQSSPLRELFGREFNLVGTLEGWRVKDKNSQYFSQLLDKSEILFYR